MMVHILSPHSRDEDKRIANNLGSLPELHGEFEDSLCCTVVGVGEETRNEDTS